MKKKLKVLFIYLGVILLSLLMTVVICAAFLFFYRDGSIFGIQYVKKNEVLYARVQNVDIEDVDGICIEGNNFDVQVNVNPHADEVVGALVNKSFGYIHKSKAQAGIVAKFEIETRTIVFTITEPEGWLSRKNCYVAIGIPESMIERGFNIESKTVKGDVFIGGDKQMKVYTVDINSSKGEVTLSNLNIVNDLNVNIGSGWLFVDEKCVSSNVKVNVKVGSGVVNLARAEGFTMGVVTIESIKSGKVGILKADEVLTEGNIEGGGKIQIGTVKELMILTLDTDIEVGTIGEEGSESVYTSRIDITGNGDIKIHRVYSGLQITGHNGDVTIGNATGGISLATNQGDIFVDNAYKTVSVDTQYGNANIKFAPDAPMYSSAEGYRALVGVTKNGHIIAKGLQNANVIVREKGRVSLDYDLVLGVNDIKATQIGIIDIVVPYEYFDNRGVAINLKTVSETKPDVKVGTVTSEHLEPVDGVYTLIANNIYGNASGNTLSVENVNGSIKIRSRNLIEF